MNNITAYRILHTCYEILLDSFRHQTTSDFDKLIEQNGNKNTAKIATPIFLIIKIHIGPNRLLEYGVAIANYDSEGRLCGRCQGFDWSDYREIKEAVADAKDDKNEVEDP